MALTIGDKQRLSTIGGTDLARLGIVHLLVISGLHIGLIALIGTAGVRSSGLSRAIILCRQLMSIGWGLASPRREILDSTWIAPVSGLLAAFLYSLLAGFLAAHPEGADCGGGSDRCGADSKPSENPPASVYGYGRYC